ncbi:MAG: nucleoside hydrolase [Bacteroidales bacterium]|nr:nucleoside hydrolase [Bacteroidales bacterium]
MKKLGFFLIYMSAIIYPIDNYSQTKIIFDTDFGGDADDLGALCMLHNFMDKGECELLGIMCWSTERYAVSAIDAVNRFYNHPYIPIGTRKGDIYFESWSYSKPVTDSFYHELNYENVLDATLLYRQLLSRNADTSITIVTVGPLKNIENLIKSDSDTISHLNGKELITKKVKEFVIMGGQFPVGENEWNFNGNMPGVTKFVIQNISVPITFAGYEIGEKIKTGEIFNHIDKRTPLYVGFMHFSNHAPWMQEYRNGKIINNSSYDQTAVFYAVRNGTGIYWDKITEGYCEPDENGGNEWIPGKTSNHSYLKLKMDAKQMAALIESVMLNDF